MKRLLIGPLFAAAMLMAPSAYASEQTVRLSMPDMFCASCPYLVEQAISAVDGVDTVDATIEGRSAVVTFDDAVTSVGQIQQAAADIGYPSTIVTAEDS